MHMGTIPQVIFVHFILLFPNIKAYLGAKNGILVYKNLDGIKSIELKVVVHSDETIQDLTFAIEKLTNSHTISLHGTKHLERKS